MPTTIPMLFSFNSFKEAHLDNYPRKHTEIVEKVFKSGQNPLHAEIQEQQHYPPEYFQNVKQAATTYEYRETANSISHTPSFSRSPTPNRLPADKSQPYMAYTAPQTVLNRASSINKSSNNTKTDMHLNQNDPRVAIDPRQYNVGGGGEEFPSNLNSILHEIVLHESMNQQQINSLKNRVSETQNLYYQNSNLINVMKEAKEQQQHHQYTTSTVSYTSTTIVPETKQPVFWVSEIPKEKLEPSLLGAKEIHFVEAPHTDLSKIMREANDHFAMKPDSTITQSYSTTVYFDNNKVPHNEPGLVNASQLVNITKEVKEHEASIPTPERKLSEHEVHIVLVNAAF